MNELKVLMVDDEAKILEAYARELHGEVNLDTASSGAEGLEAANTNGPYAVVISDYKMPQMNGVDFLNTLERDHPDTVRIMLTGYADLKIAMLAVNRGHIFRLLTKPCSTEDLLDAIRDGIKQYKLVAAERELLEETLSGSVKVLTEVLSISNPIAFRRSARIRSYVKQMAKALNLKGIWEFELAAQLSHIGCFTMEESLLAKVYNGTRLTEDEFKAYSDYPKISASLIEKIPRLKSVAEIIASQSDVFTKRVRGDNFNGEDRKAVGGYLIKVALEFDQFITRGASVRAVLTRLRSWMDYPSPNILKSMKDIKIIEEKAREISVRVPDLNRNMVFLEDIFATDGMLLVSRGENVTYPVMARLRNYSKGIGVVQPFMVALQVIKRNTEYND